MSEVTFRTLVVERELQHSVEKVWRALTEPLLMAEWLMPNDFEPVVGRNFELRAAWGTVHCEVLAVEPNRHLAYTWAAYGLESVVAWTLTPNGVGTRLRMEHSGFGMDQEQAYQGAMAGWQPFLTNLEQVVKRLD